MRRRRPLLRSWQRTAPTAAVVQRDGKVVVAGELGTALLVLRFRTDGSLDPGFGTAGKVELAPGRGLPLVGYLTKGQYLNGRLVLRPWARPEGLALQRDGRIVLVGTMGQPDGPPYLFAARLMDE